MKNPHKVKPTRLMCISECDDIYPSSGDGPAFGHYHFNTFDLHPYDIEIFYEQCIIHNIGFGYEYHPKFQSSLFTGGDMIETSCELMDYEVYGIDYKNRYTINKLCKHPDIMMEYVKTNDISEESLKQFDDDIELLSDLFSIMIDGNIGNNSVIRLKISNYYLKNPSELLPNTHIVDKQCDECLGIWLKKNSKWDLIYRASEHEYSISSFHQYCDNQGPTLIIIKTTQGWIFGAYITKNWRSDRICILSN